MKRRRFLSGLAVSALVPPAFATDYLSIEGAQKALFPAADRFVPLSLARGAAALRVPDARVAAMHAFTAYAGDQLVGYVVADAVIGKFELIGYAVGLTPERTINGLEILWYRESHGYEIRQPAWRAQFTGKTAASPLRVGSDIANISGATLSTTHVTDGVRLVAQLVQATTA
ncbi:MAG: FMN-binding protein [Proteobacteria bacterium]|nr:FMN-binding protein [Pseudomonadota bacterium]